jgi:hypothetical protein
VGTLTNPRNSTINANALRPFLGYSAISVEDTGDNSNYNSLQMAVRRRMAQGLSFGASYTFSRTLDSSSGTPQNSYNAGLDYGLSSIHRKQVLNFNYIYELPFFAKDGRMLLKEVLGGWSVSGVTAFQGGAPYSVTVPVDIAGIGVASSRATLAGNPNLPAGQRTPGLWFDAKAALPTNQMTSGQFGASGRNILIGPGFNQWDVSLSKVFQIREKARIQFRAESYNIWNHPSFTALNTTVHFDNAGNPSQGYGAVAAAGPGRTLAFGAKVLF